MEWVTLGVNNWKKVALNRDEWTKLLKKPTGGCRANDDDDDVLLETKNHFVVSQFNNPIGCLLQ